MYISIEIGGSVRGLKFNQMAMITVARYLDYENIEATFAYALVYAGLKANCFVKREEFTHSFEEVCDWVEQMDPADLLKVKDVFEQTQAFKSITESKEKVTKKKPRTKSESPTE
jgi:hypothetical protein